MIDRSLPRWLVLAGVVALFATLVAWLAWPSEDRPIRERPGFLFSYAAASGALAGMTEPEAEEQLRDWAKVGLATDLELGTDGLVDGFYDTFPIRDDGFADLARQPVGPGRSLYADGVLHLLVPRDDPHRERTLALLLDQYRADAGADPGRVQVHPYTVRPGIEAILIGAEEPVVTEDFRGAHGYVRMRIDSSQGLTDFLARTRALSTVEAVGDELWAGGWRWADGEGQRLTREDVAVPQRAYETASDDKMPAFSLDPAR